MFKAAIGAWTTLRWHERTITLPPTAMKTISGRENIAADIGHQSGHRSKQDSHSSTPDQAPILGESGYSGVSGVHPP